MPDSNPEKPTPEQPVKKPITLFDCWSGSAVAGGIAYGAYLMTANIIGRFAAKPLPTDMAYLARSIGVAVRTLVMGISAMATFIFGFVALGLFALGIQLLFRPRSTPEA